MGLLSRSKSFRGNPSSLQTPRNDRETLQHPGVNITTDFDVSSAHLAQNTFDTPLDKQAYTHYRPLASNPATVRPQYRTLARESQSLARPSTSNINAAANDDGFRFPNPSTRTSNLGGSISGQNATIGIALGSPRIKPAQYVDTHLLNEDVRRPSPLQTSIQSPHHDPVSVSTSTPKSAVSHPTAPKRPQIQRQKSSGLKSFFGLIGSNRIESDLLPSGMRQDSTPTQDRPSTRHSNSIGASETLRMPVDSVTNFQLNATPRILPGHVEKTSKSRGMTRQEKQMEVERMPKEKDTKIKIRKHQKNHTIANPYITAADTAWPRYLLSPELELDKSSSNGSGAKSSATTGDAAVPRSKYSLSRPDLLNVDIPSVKLERYSVMFEKVLEQKPQQSLLERRHGTLKRLQPVSGTSGMVSRPT